MLPILNEPVGLSEDQSVSRSSDDTVLTSVAELRGGTLLNAGGHRMARAWRRGAVIASCATRILPVASVRGRPVVRRFGPRTHGLDTHPMRSITIADATTLAVGRGGWTRLEHA
ncbi:MAG: hypothetical protein HOP29_01115 [Phycisphaerales bacterium]|nr:hypothetical protein [Phycisphaerales bacterium]